MNKDGETETSVELPGHFKWRAARLRIWVRGQMAGGNPASTRTNLTQAAFKVRALTEPTPQEFVRSEGAQP